MFVFPSDTPWDQLQGEAGVCASSVPQTSSPTFDAGALIPWSRGCGTLFRRERYCCSRSAVTARKDGGESPSCFRSGT